MNNIKVGDVVEIENYSIHYMKENKVKNWEGPLVISEIRNGHRYVAVQVSTGMLLSFDERCTDFKPDEWSGAAFKLIEDPFVVAAARAICGEKKT